ncbi:sensor histidine kinase [Salidesulfovibrio brasiliensis]|uniref:sensor histidine kinase n=1 Tax=Salidesulfovibrio brasiliensis TaxID=221711 RepID=UPI0006D2B519|nr:PAS domain S-box protein [Salidesulfovibrio brasiliensis]
MEWDRGFVDALFVSVFEMDAEGVLTYANTAGKDLLLLTDEAIAKRPFARLFVHEEDRERWAASWGQVRKDAPLRRNEYRLVRTDGAVVHVVGSSTRYLTPDGAEVYRGVFLDITRHMEVEESLRRSDERYALVVRGANDGIWDWDVKRDQVYFSPRYKEMLGHTDEDFGNHADEWRDRIHPDDVERVLAANAACIKGEVEQFEVEFRMRHRDGSWKWILGRGAGVADENGKVVRIGGTHTDISTRKMAEEAIKVSEELHSALSRATFEAVFILEGGFCVAANDSAVRLFGYSSSELAGLGPTVLFIEEDVPRVRDMMISNGGEALEAKGLRKDGTRFSAEIRWRILQFRGRRTRVLTVRDISRRKEAEEHYRNIFENAMEGIYQSLPNGQFRTVNSSFSSMLGYDSPEEMLALVTDIASGFYVNPEMRQALLDKLEREGAVHAYEVQVCRKDGKPMWISESVRRVTDDAGAFLYYEGFVQDISKRKENEQISAALYRISRAVSVTADLQELYSTIHDVLREALSARNFFIARLHEEEDRLSFSYFQDEHDHPYDLYGFSDPDTRGLTIDVIRSGRTIFLHRDEMVRRRESGEMVIRGAMPASWIGVPLKVRGKVIGAMVVQDYSNPNQYTDADVLFLESVSEQVALAIERKSNEQRIIRLNETLESKVEQRTLELQRRTAELEAANRRLQELDKLKSSLISSISHELRTPLTSIRGFAKLVYRDLSRKIRDTLNDEDAARIAQRMGENLHIIESEGERLTRLINDFLDLSRIEAGKTVWNRSRFDPAPVVRQAGESAFGHMIDSEVSLRIEVPEALPVVDMDEDRLRQVLSNLLNNATKFTERGSIEISAFALNGSVQIAVSDTGCGIAPETLPHVFDRFHKGTNGDTVADREGTGLGLAICREIVESFGGAITVESQVGQGSVFTVSLPQASARTSAPPTCQRRRGARNSPWRLCRPLPKGHR